jgi:hypothetical protein
VRTQPAGVSFVTEIIRNWTGAPGSPKRTWAENDIFECFQLDGSAAPNGFSWTDSLKRSWASPGFPVKFGGVGERGAPVQFLLRSAKETASCRVEYSHTL